MSNTPTNLIATPERSGAKSRRTSAYGAWPPRWSRNAMTKSRTFLARSMVGAPRLQAASLARYDRQAAEISRLNSPREMGPSGVSQGTSPSDAMRPIKVRTVKAPRLKPNM